MELQNPAHPLIPYPSWEYPSAQRPWKADSEARATPAPITKMDWLTRLGSSDVYFRALHVNLAPVGILFWG
jgi:hypothetical protein